jgi:hypothetical protein
MCWILRDGPLFPQSAAGAITTADGEALRRVADPISSVGGWRDHDGVLPILFPQSAAGAITTADGEALRRVADLPSAAGSRRGARRDRLVLARNTTGDCTTVGRACRDIAVTAWRDADLALAFDVL